MRDLMFMLALPFIVSVVIVLWLGLTAAHTPRQPKPKRRPAR